MTTQLTKQTVIDSFTAAIEEIEVTTLTHFIIAMADCGTPLRSSKDRVAFYGERIYSVATEKQAKAVAANINAQFEKQGSETRVQVERRNDWRARRTAVLKALIADIAGREVL